MSDINISNMRKLDGNLLLVFVALHEHRNATSAANQLAMTQSAVSHNLARLRDLFDDPLFTRRPHGLVPTPASIALLPKVKQLLDLAATTLGTRPEFDPETAKRTFNFSAPEFFTAMISSDMIAQLREKAPGVNFWCQHLPSEDSLAALRRFEIDFAIGKPETLLASDLETRQLFSDQYCVVARKHHPDIKGRLSLTRYRRNGIVFASAGSELLAGEQSANYDDMNVLAVVPHWLTALSIVSTSDAIASCPERLARKLQQPMGLQVIKHPLKRFPIEVAVTTRQRENDPGLVWFLEQLYWVCSI